jgi:hypothetical protein
MTELNKITLTGILRWIFGILFLLLFLGSILGSHYLAALIALVAAIVLVPLLSSAIESKLNFTMSGALRFVLVLCLFAGFFVATPTNSPINSPTKSPTQIADLDISSASTNATGPAAQDSSVCYWDWHYTTTHQIGSAFVAPSGKSYAIVDIYLKNNADGTVSTNPFNWNFISNGITYQMDSSTFDQSIHSETVDVGKGGETTCQIVYLINGEPDTAELKYTGIMGPDMVRVQHFDNIST